MPMMYATCLWPLSLLLLSLNLEGDVVVSAPDDNDIVPTEVDVVIVGAGAAGLAAASRFEEFADDGITYVVLEAADYVGGRVRSTVLDDVTTNFFGNYLVESGANWITDYPGNPIMDLALEYDLGMTLQEFFDIDAYDEDGSPIRSKIMMDTQKDFLKAWKCLQQFTNVPYNNGGDGATTGYDQLDIGGINLLDLCGWEKLGPEAADNLRYFWQWYYMDFEYAQGDVSLSTFPEDAFFRPTYLVTDQNHGFQGLFERFAQDRINMDNVFLEHEVTKIDYSVPLSAGFNAVVTVRDKIHDATRIIKSKRVVSTMSVGVLREKNKQIFDPLLDLSLLPLRMMQYVKVFFQFDNKFWGDEEFIVTIRDADQRGQCHHWQNLATTGKRGNSQVGRKGTTNEFLTADSNILFCTLITDAFFELVDENNELTQETLDDLLLPLQNAFPDDYEAPIANFYPGWVNDELAGRGAYSNWDVEPTKTWAQSVQDYFRFFGGKGLPHGNFPDGWYRAVNGYQDDVWVLHISGTGSCFEHWEFVHGGFESGLRSANYILFDWGLVEERDRESTCEDF